jgi:hypothetical protein
VRRDHRQQPLAASPAHQIQNQKIAQGQQSCSVTLPQHTAAGARGARQPWPWARAAPTQHIGHRQHTAKRRSARSAPMGARSALTRAIPPTTLRGHGSGRGARGSTAHKYTQAEEIERAGERTSLPSRCALPQHLPTLTLHGRVASLTLCVLNTRVSLEHMVLHLGGVSQHSSGGEGGRRGHPYLYTSSSTCRRSQMENRLDNHSQRPHRHLQP